MSLLSKLTIIILTYDRPRYVLRNMGFWSATGATVHVLDGSSEAISPQQLDRFASNIHYHHMPISYWMRFAEVSSLVDTEYAALLSDDEFFVPSAVEASIRELEKNKDLVACCGMAVDKVLATDLAVHWSALKGNRSRFEGGPSGAIDQADPVERMIKHMDPYIPSIIYSVCRSQAWLKTMRLIGARQFSSGHVGELQFELSMSFNGKVKAIGELMLLRSAENEANSTTHGFELMFHTWYLDPKFSQEVDQFLHTTASNLVAGSGMELDKIRRGLELACSAYVAYCERNYPAKQPGQPSPNTIRRPASRVPRTLKVFTRKFISALPAPLLAVLPDRLRFRPYADIAKELESAGLRVDWNQLSLILALVQKGHDSKSKLLRN